MKTGSSLDAPNLTKLDRRDPDDHWWQDSNGHLFWLPNDPAERAAWEAEKAAVLGAPTLVTATAGDPWS